MNLNKKIHYEGYCWLLLIVAIIILISTLLGYLGRYYWFFDLFVNFKVQYLVVSFVCGIILLLFAKFAFPVQVKEKKSLLNSSKTASTNITKNNTTQQSVVSDTCIQNSLPKKHIIYFSLFCFMVSFLNTIEVTPLYLHSNKSDKKEHSSSNNLKIINCNVLTSNIEYSRLEQLVLNNNPDILVLEEVNQNWINNIPKIKKAYPYSKIYPQSDNFGIAIFAKQSSLKAKIHFFTSSNIPYIEATFKIDNKLITLFAVHTMPPIGESRFQERNAMLDEVAEKIKQLKNQPVILIGDLNITPWSYFFKKFLKDTKLRNSQKGFGIQPSWPTSPHSLLIPLDHCLVSKNFSVINRFVGEDIGSDHYPIVLQLKIL
jgi:endonuclease/exonuclease/phosphatase (EEP) superfamily protein YafD